jgi:hypothetical protein
VILRHYLHRKRIFPTLQAHHERSSLGLGTCGVIQIHHFSED